VVAVVMNRIIVGCDADPSSRDAVRFGAVLARVTGAELILAHAYRHDRAAALDLLSDAERRVPYGTRAQMRAVKSGSPSHALHDLADAENADVIVIGRRRDTRGQTSFVTGARCPVAVAPRGFADERDPALRVIGVAFDGSPEARAAVDVAAMLANAAGAAIRLIGVAHEPARPASGMTGAWVAAEFDHHAALQRELESAADELPPDLRPQVVLRRGDPAATLIDEGAPLSLLVMGSHDRGPIRRALLGSVSAAVLRDPPCPVLVAGRAAQLREAAA
jgi:nucleotide-binding universal stress UspA family protein